jgi:hypothetical protein
VLRTGQYRFNRTAPILFSPVDPHVLYLGSNVLFMTRDGGNSWQIISPDLTREDPGVPSNLGQFVDADAAKGKHRGVIYSIAPSPKNGNMIWAGTDDGLIHVTRDGGESWENVTPHELTSWSKIAQMDASHFDTATAYAAVNRFRLDDLHPYIYRTHDGGETWQKIVNGLPDEPVNTVREDPERKGLLFAGTERSVYVSFDDGDHWQALKLNLPPTSIRDLVVHNDDVVVGTHGRSFWILDNITPLRQAGAQVASAPSHLFAPQMTYRIRRNNNTDTPLPPEEPAGQNPPDGAMIDYWLSSGASGSVVLEIRDDAGTLVRRFSSADKPERVNEKELNVPTYWVRPARTLSAAPGMHRFIWDLTYPAPDVLSRDYPISAVYRDTPLYPLGATVLPGQYKVVLTVAGGKSETQSLTIHMDPRVKTSADDLHRQFELDRKISDALHRDYQAILQVRSLRAQLKSVTEHKPSPEVAAKVANLEAQAAVIEGVDGAQFLSTPEGRSLVRLNSGLGTLLSALDSADAAPTTQQSAMFADLEKALNTQLAAWEQIKAKDVAELNSQLSKAGLPVIDLQKSGAGSANTAQTSSQDRDKDLE